MSQRENNVFHRLKDRVCRPEDRFERVENGIGTGMPDINYVIARTEGWIELKAPVEPVRPATPLFGSNHNVDVDQANWLLKQYQAGGVGWLFIATEKRLLLISGENAGKLGAKRINAMCAHDLEKITAWRSPVPVLDKMRWADLREVLGSR